MASNWTKMQKLAAAAVGLSSGAAIYLYTNRKDELIKNQIIPSVFNSWTTNTKVPPEAIWDFNWDHREPTSLVKPVKPTTNETDEEKLKEKLDKVKAKSVRHIILIRHGQYNLNGETDEQRYLTEVGKSQASFTGERLKTLNIPWDKIVKSTMTRAQETGQIITTKLDGQYAIENCSLIEEGAPIAPQPPIGHWRPEPSQFFQDGARIEAGFRKHFHRADGKQEKDSYTMIVCHANVIRYFVCRALQIPPEAWLRMSLNHASITWLSILPSGRVILRAFGDSGHIPPAYITSR